MITVSSRFCFEKISKKDMKKKECCPPTSIGERIADASYVLKGKWETWTPTDGKNGASIRTYVVGKNTTKTIVVAHDIFGPTSGRLVEICDELARDLNVRVVMPDFFHGKPFLDQNTYGAPVRALSSSSEFKNTIKHNQTHSNTTGSSERYIIREMWNAL